MAQRVNVILVDDIDGSDAEENVRFAIDGVSYEIDLTSEHASELRSALARFVGHARRLDARRTKTQRATASGVSAADIRRWARENGWDVPDRGRVSAEVRQAYAAAH
ncbi:MAG TPA: Lsr2 family protein [Nocardioidaceae bacterium]|nr:Lsr2 family protein [Nocardioidaceae bacterium]